MYLFLYDLSSDLFIYMFSEKEQIHMRLNTTKGLRQHKITHALILFSKHMLSVPQYRVLVHGSLMVRALSKFEKVKKWYCKFVKLTINYKLSLIINCPSFCVFFDSYLLPLTREPSSTHPTQLIYSYGGKNKRKNTGLFS